MQQVEGTKKQVDAEQKILFRQTLQQRQALAPRLQAQMRQNQECLKQRISKVQELLSQGEKAAAAHVPECSQTKDPPELEKLETKASELGTKAEELSERLRQLEARARRLIIRIEGNTDPGDLSTGPAQPFGTLSGHPLYRKTETSGAGARILLSVHVGPLGFHNPLTGTWPGRAELKSLVIHANLSTRAETADMDEAVARQMLQKVDFAGLAKLVQP